MKKYFILFIITTSLLSACKKESPKESISLCASQFDKVVDLHIQFKVGEICKRTFVYRSEDNNTFHLLKEIDLAAIKNDSIWVIDNTIKTDGTYSYKISYGSFISQIAQVNFKLNTPTFQVPTTAKDTLVITAQTSCLPYTFSLYNRWGEIILTDNNCNGNKSFDVANLPIETYICFINYANRKKSYSITISR